MRPSLVRRSGMNAVLCGISVHYGWAADEGDDGMPQNGAAMNQGEAAICGVMALNWHEHC